MSSAAQRLDSDALFCVLALLTLPELLAAAQSCRSWSACAVAIPSIHAAFNFGWSRDPEKRAAQSEAEEKANESDATPPQGRLSLPLAVAAAARIACLSRSSLRKHVGSIGCPVGSDDLELVPLTVKSIGMLSRLPSLRWLDVHCIDAGEGNSDADFRLPASLTYLRIDTCLSSDEQFPREWSDVCNMILLLSAAGHCTQLKTIELECNSSQPQVIVLSALLQLSASLTSLQIFFDLNLTQVRVVQGLRSFSCYSTVFSPLEPHQLKHLHTLDCNHEELSVPDLEYLASLPSLTRFPNQWRWQFAALPLLRNLQLRELKLGPILRPERQRGEEGYNTISSTELLDALEPCAMMTMLERFDLSSVHDLLSDQDAAALFSPCAHLRVLCLSDLRVQSLQFLLLLPALRQLSIWGCTDSLSPADLSVLLSLKSLERLHLDEERTEPRWISSSVLTSLSVLPSILLPRLRCFHYEARANDSQAECRVQVPNRDCELMSERIAMDLAVRSASIAGRDLPSTINQCRLPSYL